MSDTKARLDFALDVAREASELILTHYQDAGLDVELKGDQSPVTIADRGAEQLIRARLAEEFPGDGVLGEEFPETPSSTGYRWILDPIDGTKSFVHGVPLFGTLIGIQEKERTVAGVCRFPALDEVIYAHADGGAWWKIRNRAATPARVTSVNALADALFCVTTITGWEKIGRQDVFDRLINSTRLTRGWGDCYGHMLVATGRADVMVDPEMSIWDAAALLPIVQEAGGHFLDWSGQPNIDSGNGLSVNAPLRDAVLQTIQG